MQSVVVTAQKGLSSYAAAQARSLEGTLLTTIAAMSFHGLHGFSQFLCCYVFNFVKLLCH